ncbi:MAG: hypothetical protein ACRDEA_13435 [Microcystaceae cyanobacterium]
MIISDLEHLEIISPDASFCKISKVSGGINLITFAQVFAQGSDTALTLTISRVAVVSLSFRGFK